MRLPPTTPIWNLRLFRRLLLAFFIGHAAAGAACLLLGHFKAAAALAIPVFLWWMQWRAAKRFTTLAERWATRQAPKQ